MGEDMLTTMKYISTVPFSGLFNWSVQYLNDSKIAFSKAYPMMHVGEFLRRNKTAVTIQDGVKYKRVTIKVRNGGVVLRDEVIGEKIGTKKQYLVLEGQFILSKIDARNGAMGIIPSELDGAIVTQDFLSYDIDTTRVNPQYFLLVSTTKQFVKYCQSCSNGTTNRQRVDEAQFLNIKIPVPSLEEQNKLVEEYNSIVSIGISRFRKSLVKDREASSYLSESIGISELYPNSTSEKTILFELVSYKNIQEWSADKILNSKGYASGKYETITLNREKSLYVDIKRGKSPKYSSDSSVFVLNQKCIRWGNIEAMHAKSVDKEWLQSIDKDCFTQEGDILVNSTGEGTIGRAAIVDKALEDLLYDSHILLLRLNKNKILPKYFMYVFNSKYGQEQVENVKSAKTTKQTELGVDNLKKIQIPIPPKAIQEKIVSDLDIMYEEIADLQRLDLYYENALKAFEAQIFE